MKQKVKSVLKKTAKIAGVTCLTAGTIAILTSGMALKAVGEGGKYLANTVRRIIGEHDEIVESHVAAEAELVTESTPLAQ